MILYIAIALVVVIILTISYWFWVYKPSQSTIDASASIQPTVSASIQPIVSASIQSAVSTPIQTTPPPPVILADQNTAMAAQQPVLDQKIFTNSTTATSIRSYDMPTTRDQQLNYMAGNWATIDGIKYTFDSVDLVADKFVITKTAATPISISYVVEGWTNNIIHALGSDGKNASFTYEGASMVLQVGGQTILLIRQA
jgi:hypothetical protein